MGVFFLFVALVKRVFLCSLFYYSLRLFDETNESPTNEFEIEDLILFNPDPIFLIIEPA
jgi:hypothetical protein